MMTLTDEQVHDIARAIHDEGLVRHFMAHKDSKPLTVNVEAAVIAPILLRPHLAYLAHADRGGNSPFRRSFGFAYREGLRPLPEYARAFRILADGFGALFDALTADRSGMFGLDDRVRPYVARRVQASVYAVSGSGRANESLLRMVKADLRVDLRVAQATALRELLRTDLSPWQSARGRVAASDLFHVYGLLDHPGALSQRDLARTLESIGIPSAMSGGSSRYAIGESAPERVKAETFTLEVLGHASL